MQAVILAAGKGTRMGALTKDTPKSMLKVAGKSILEWKLEALPDTITEVIIVTGYLGNIINETFGSAYNGKKISYVTQPNLASGTMDALISARPLLRGVFLVMNGDDIHSKEDLEQCVQNDWALAVSHTEDLRSASCVVTNAAGEIIDIVEADQHSGGAGLAGVGVYTLDTSVFDVEPVILKGRTESGLPQTMLAASRKFSKPISAIFVSFPLHFTTPNDIQCAEGVLTRKK